MTSGLKTFYLLFCLLVAFMIWTMAYGAALGWFFGDWRIFQGTITENPFLPAQQFWTYSDNERLRTVAGGAVIPALLITGLLAYVGLRSPSNPLGDAAFQSPGEMARRKWFQRKGHIFGRVGRRILRVRDERHHLVIGPTRSGKGAGYVIPNALMHEGSMIVTDLKGEIYAATAGHRQKKGSRVFLFAPGADRTHRYNPLDFIRDERGTRTTDIQNVASILVPENTDSENAVWQATAQQVMAGAISYILESPFYKGRRNLGEVNSLFNSGENLQALMKRIKAAEPGLSKFTVESFNAYLGLSERAAASALLDIQKAMRPFKNERITAATAVTDMDIHSLQRRPISIYLAPNITDVTLVTPLLTLFVQQVMSVLLLNHDPKAVPVYFLLDEFRQLKRMDEIVGKLPYVAGYGIKLAFIVQDLKTLDEIYGETTRQSLLGNCAYQLVLGANDQVTADYTSRALGKRTIRYQSESRTIELLGLNRRTRVEQIRERDLMMPQEVRQMPEDRMVLLIEGQRPIFGQKLQFFKTEPFRSAEAFSQRHKPEVPPIEYLPPLPVPVTTDDYGVFSPIEQEPRKPPPSPTPPDEHDRTTNTVSDEEDVDSEATNPVEEPEPSAPRDERSVSQSVILRRRPAKPVLFDPPHQKPRRPRLDVEQMLADTIARLEPAEDALRAVITTKEGTTAGDGPRKRKGYMEIWQATVPDPELDQGAELPATGLND
ncbi:type IV secretory system conjugative DNA transfer family protein [Notoacmeibacter sp. MSK16QG-6]|uniref:type IV secretory system conjugative DNA transfer family protein n=1 Tax=Notoacmeibacter sp. MSK16QG-6 TaxID=2957982 RepID=UPI0020A03771|nr:type IV secretory system conjugative DNA transfer family protein [Notoacmeibacter sp. MSK16QG-6]MCP1201108.1 type IV secretory system conjugative DNA transfer family protein [Notoacmeibacter sp. MSK16QG-6]